jgi:hypothetical protein
MRLYVDDDLASPLLAQLLRRAGHDVRLPAELAMTGNHDADHLRQAVREGRVCLSCNYRDFEFLHLLVLETQGHHPGILIGRLDNNPRRDLKPRDIVRAIAKLETANVALTDQYIILNHWR